MPAPNTLKKDSRKLVNDLLWCLSSHPSKTAAPMPPLCLPAIMSNSKPWRLANGIPNMKDMQNYISCG
jgi:hypothetical protein